MAAIPEEGDESGDYEWICSSFVDGTSHTDFSTVSRTSAFGGANEDFGAGLTYDEVNSPEFGVTYRVNPDSDAVVKAYYVRVKVHYSVTVDKGTVPTGPESLADVCVNGPVVVAVGANGLIFTSSDKGGTWTQRTSGVSETLYSVIFDGTQYIVGGQNGRMLTSNDGTTWTSVSTSTLQDIYGLAYGGGKLIATGSNEEVLVGTGVDDLENRATEVDPYTQPA